MTVAMRSAVENARAALDGDGDRVGSGEGSVRYELFHAANSICSQKVRCILAHHDLAYVSYPMNLFLGQTYLPDYVRLRMIGCERLGGPLVARHGGTTATEAGGCDGAVVPTLVDWADDEVIVDSKRICVHLDNQVRERDRLRPAHLAAAIDSELAIVDNLPNYQMLMGRTPSGGEQGESREHTHAAFSRRKVDWCDRYLADHAGDAALVRAYEAKRDKEASAAEGLFSREAMRAAYDRAEAALDDLEGKLGDSGSDAWLFGERVTMADLFWGIELLRMRDVGIAPFWEDGRRPGVERFAARTEQLSAIRSAVVDWPGARF